MGFDITGSTLGSSNSQLTNSRVLGLFTKAHTECSSLRLGLRQLLEVEALNHLGIWH